MTLIFSLPLELVVAVVVVVVVAAAVVAEGVKTNCPILLLLHLETNVTFSGNVQALICGLKPWFALSTEVLNADC